MNAFIVIGVAALVLLMQFLVTPNIPQHLLLRFSFDTELAEPSEKIVCNGKLTNNWFLPVIYMCLYEHIPEGAVVSGKKDNKLSHRIFLFPHSSFKHKVYFTLPKRGIYRSGKYYVETGDFLGFNSKVLSGRINANLVVMPKRCEDAQVLNVLGGYLGDISVRRFILEDPVLTMGYLDYTGREPMKKISWKHSAKVGKLMVKNSDYTVDANAAVVLNMDTGSAKEKEKSFEIVRSVCEQLEQKQIPYEFLSNGDAGNLKEGYGKKHMDQLMTNLGRSGLCGFSSFDKLVERCIRGQKKNRSFFIISPPLSPKDKQALARLQSVSEYELCVLEAEVD